MIGALIKLKFLKLTWFSAVAAGLTIGAVSTLVAKETCKKRSSNQSEENESDR